MKRDLVHLFIRYLDNETRYENVKYVIIINFMKKKLIVLYKIKKIGARTPSGATHSCYASKNVLPYER